MTIEASVNVEAAKVAADVKQDRGEWKEDGAELDYTGEVNEKQTINDQENSANACNEEHFVAVDVPVKALQVPVSIEPDYEVTPVPSCPEPAPAAETTSAETKELRPFRHEETILIFDWDDTCLPSAWVQSQGLRLDEDSKVNEAQRQQLVQVANAVMETIRIAKQHGTVVLVTNAERGWIELSCQKFMPTLYPALESVKLVSARTTYESCTLTSPLDWKLHAFESELMRVFGSETITEPERRKNVLSLGDSMHEREALLRATATMPNCRSKSLKFVERPDIGQICKQHSLITGCFDRIVHHDGNLDLCIRCA